MEWAKDYRGGIVRAQRGAYFGFFLTCPTCGERVCLRSGKTRQPHFAHYSKRAKPDCEYYHPSPDVLHRSVPRPPPNNSMQFPKRDSLRCGLFLAHRFEHVGFELFLRIPSLAQVGQLNGSLELQHGRGVKAFSAIQLTKAYTIPVSPTVPILECSGTGDLLALSDHLMLQTGSFVRGMNLFSAIESGGRFLFSRESMEWGGRYWIVTDAPITPPDQVISVIEWSRCGSLAKWHVYEAGLPATPIASSLNTEEILSDFFDRHIRIPQPRAYLVHPLPHHLAIDGAYVYPRPPEILYVRRTLSREVSVEGPPDQLANTVVTALSDDWVQIKGIQQSTQDVAILISGIEQAVIRIEECALIQPGGLHAYAGEVSWDLLVDMPLSPGELFSQNVRVECGGNRLAEHIAGINNGWILDGSAVTLPEKTDKILSAGGFGEIRPASSGLAESLDADKDTVDPQQNRQLPKATWIDGLIRAKHGPQAASHVRDFIANPSNGNQQKLGPILTGPLMAHIRAAADQQGNQ